jgi:hypothetical protein
MSASLNDIVAEMVHRGVAQRQTLSRGLILIYRPPQADGAPYYTLAAARPNVFPSDAELAIVRSCLEKALETHPRLLSYDLSHWASEQRANLAVNVIRWRHWPIRDMLIAPLALQPILRAALARRQ